MLDSLGDCERRFADESVCFRREHVGDIDRRLPQVPGIPVQCPVEELLVPSQPSVIPGNLEPESRYEAPSRGIDLFHADVIKTHLHGASATHAASTAAESSNASCPTSQQHRVPHPCRQAGTSPPERTVTTMLVVSSLSRSEIAWSLGLYLTSNKLWM